MDYEIRSLDASHAEALLPLWNADAGRVYPPAPIRAVNPGDLAPVPDPQKEDVTLRGAFRNGRLVAAIKCWRRTADAPAADCGNLLSGDGVISWLFFDDAAGAEELWRQTSPLLGKRIYAFPEYEDMARYSIFSTGMLSVGRSRIAAFFERHGFTVPIGEAWGPQERICFRLSLPERSNSDMPSLPPGFHIKIEQKGLAIALQLRRDDGSVIGESSMGPARAEGREIPGAALLGWLGVNSAYRGQGLGTVLLKTQIHQARRQGMTDLYLTTHAGRPAWKLYQRVGFQEVDRLRSYVRAGKRA